jgi:predicted CXXCH cytochrome family protein
VAAGCHASLLAAGKVHRPVAEEKCTVCHLLTADYRAESHERSSFDTPLKESELCLTCHRDLKSTLSSAHRHAPFEDSSCLLCHDPHGTPQVALLVNAYPIALHTRYGTDKYALCWECHDSALAADKFTASATGFRRGKRNFHYSHLHKGKGMTCRACHSPHAAEQAFIIRSDGPPGATSWNGTQVFHPAPDGGRCSGGCHTDVSYRR